MNLPHRRIPERDAFDQNILTAIWLQEHWPQITSVAEHSLAYGRAFVDVLIKQTARLALIGITFLPSTTSSSFPWPPMFAIGLAVDDACAGDRDVPLLKGIDEWRVAHQLHAFPAGENDGQILFWVTAEFDRRVSGDVKIDVAL